MKFTTSSQTLTKHLQSLAGLLTNTLPVCEAFLFNLDGRKLTIMSTDLETTMTCTMEVDSKDKGMGAVPGRILLETIKTFPDQPLTFTFGVQLEIQSENGKFKLATFDPKEYPMTKSVEGDSIELDAHKLADGISKTIYATSTDELRPILGGVYVSDSELVATDAHRLVRYSADLKGVSTFVIPKKPLSVLMKSLSGYEGKVKMRSNETNAEFTFGDYTMICRLADGKYPNFEAVIPKLNPNKLTINRNKLLNSIKRVSIYSNKTTHGVSLQMSEGKLTIAGSDSDNEANEVVECGYEGSPMKISFNGKYLSEILSNLDSEMITLETSEPNKAGIIKPTGKDILCLTMPIMEA